MEVMRPRLGFTEVQHMNCRRFHGHDIVLILKCAIEPQNLPTRDGNTVSLIHLWIDDGA